MSWAFYPLEDSLGEKGAKADGYHCFILHCSERMDGGEGALFFLVVRLYEEHVALTYEDALVGPSGLGRKGNGKWVERGVLSVNYSFLFCSFLLLLWVSS